MKKDYSIFIRHIAQSIEDIERYAGSMAEEEFISNDLVHNAVIRKLEIIGEAVGNVPFSFTSKYPSVPWQNIKDTRNKLIHKYFGVDLQLVYDILKKDLPPLKKEMKRILEQSEVP